MPLAASAAHRNFRVVMSVFLTAVHRVAKPMRPPVWTPVPVVGGCALSVNVIVPLRFVPRDDNTFVNLTVTVQVPPGCSVVPVQLSGPANAPMLKKYESALPPDTDTLLTVM
jgi:hypothetical protein